MKKLKGDLLKLAMAGEFDVIVHGCNCFHQMGAGIAKAIAAEFPEAYDADKATEYGVKAKLGTISSAKVIRGSARFVIVNAYTQFHWAGPKPRAVYSAISECFECIAEQLPEARIGYPLIGAGLAGGDWAIIAPAIDKALAGLDHTLVEFSRA